MKAFHGRAQLKTDMLVELDWHAEQDKIIKGSYGDACTNGDFRGCAIGCSIHSLARIQKKTLNTAKHELFATELGIPVEIAYLVDGLFEALPDAESKALPRRVIDAIQPGADLSMVIPQFLLWMLSDPKIGSIVDVKFDETRAFVNAVIAIFDEWVRTGEKPASDSPLGKAAWAAWAAWAARAARDARDAWAARGAWDAWDARAARGAWDARAARNIAAADKLIELLREADVPETAGRTL